MNIVRHIFICIALAVPLKAISQSAATDRASHAIFDCQQIENNEASDSSSAMRSLDPAGRVRNMFQTRKNAIDSSSIAVRLLQEPAHGKLRVEIDNTGNRFYAYDPKPGYFGKDQVVFLARMGEKRIKIVSTLQVVKISDERSDQKLCPAPQVVRIGA